MEEIEEATAEDKARWRALLRVVPDFPKPGILFQDIGPLISNAAAWRGVVRELTRVYRGRGVTQVAGAEARGYLFSAALAYALGAGVLLLRKPGKLPGERVGVDYGLEYGRSRVELSVGAVGPGDRVLVVDDLLATGGTARACCSLLEQMGAQVVSCAFLVELAGLGGRQSLAPHEVVSLLTVEEE